MVSKEVKASHELVFKYSNSDFVYNTSSDHGQDMMSAFDSLLLEKWKAADDASLFNYKVDDVETKLLAGKYKFVVQMNANRKIMKRKSQNILNVVQPFEPECFNFTKIKTEEILTNLHYEQNSPKSHFDATSEYTDGSKSATGVGHVAVIPVNMIQGWLLQTVDTVGKGTAVLEGSVVINNAPICSNHSLLVPFLDQCQPQVLNEKGLMIALHTILLSTTPDIRIGFNSLTGYASVNHFHFHLYYLSHKLNIETAECRRLAGPCYVFKDFPCPAFVFQLENKDVDELIRSVMKVIKLFLSKEIAHNLYITRGTSLDGNSTDGEYDTVRVILWARKPSYACDHWNNLSEEDIIPTIKGVCEEEFEDMSPKIMRLFLDNNDVE
ncbi:GDP-D-glucose phosphorylase 1 isoform X2 [Cherax quadricarinatus]|uniref:GDP-D-glucose phosphorylase 1 isoform X2 n=1 Tax=Cherax quadricarinatus TaxID=27406 RepID=UPI00387EB7BA